MLLLVTNIKNVLTSLQNNGFTLSQVVKDFVKSKVYAIPENYQAIAGVMILPIFSMISFWIEIFASNRWAPRVLIFILVVLNMLALLIFPLILSF